MIKWIEFLGQQIDLMNEELSKLLHSIISPEKEKTINMVFINAEDGRLYFFKIHADLSLNNKLELPDFEYNFQTLEKSEFCAVKIF